MAGAKHGSTTSVTARWIATIVASVIVAAAGLLLGLGLMGDLIANTDRARSTAATVLMTLGIFGPFVPAAIAGGRKHFSSLSRRGQWLMLVVVPLAHLTVIALLIALTVNRPLFSG
jgi:hypothetical protein